MKFEFGKEKDSAYKDLSRGIVNITILKEKVFLSPLHLKRAF